MHCLRCGRTNAEGASFCSGCGAALAPDAESTEQTVALPQSFGSITSPDAPTQAALPPRTVSGPALSVGQILGDRYEIAAVIGQRARFCFTSWP